MSLRDPTGDVTTRLDDERFMLEALQEAEAAFQEEEVPVGAIAAYENRIVARCHNQRERLQDPLSHAEMGVLRDAAKFLGTWRLNDVTLYVTLEPCAMCAGAMVQARIGRCVFGTEDPRAGAAGSILPVDTILANAAFNHRVPVEGGVLSEPCAAILKKFFENLRSSG